MLARGSYSTEVHPFCNLPHSQRHVNPVDHTHHSLSIRASVGMASALATKMYMGVYRLVCEWCLTDIHPSSDPQHFCHVEVALVFPAGYVPPWPVTRVSRLVSVGFEGNRERRVVGE